MEMLTTPDRIEEVLKAIFAMVGGQAPVVVNKENAPLIMIQLGEGQHLCLDETAYPPIWIETLKHYPGTRLDPPETVETFHSGYTWSQVNVAMLALLGLWAAETLGYVIWDLETKEIEEYRKDRGKLASEA